MALDIQSKEVIDKISRDLKVQPSLQIPRKLSENIQLIYNVNPERLIQTKNADALNTTSSTIHTTHATKETFLLGVQLAVSKDVVNDGEFSRITIFPFGKAVETAHIIRYNFTTAGDFSSSITFPKPIKLEKNSIIGVVNNSGTSLINATGIIFFYEVDPQ